MNPYRPSPSWPTRLCITLLFALAVIIAGAGLAWPGMTWLEVLTEIVERLR